MVITAKKKWSQINVYSKVFSYTNWLNYTDKKADKFRG